MAQAGDYQVRQRISPGSAAGARRTLSGLARLNRTVVFHAAGALVLAVSSLGCQGTSAFAPASTEPRVLIVGNSLTYTNDLPRTLADIGRLGGVSLVTSSVAYPDFALVDHLHLGTAVATIKNGGWNCVVLQQGPSSMPESRDSLIAWSKRFQEIVHAGGADMVLLMVWPASSRPGDWPGVHASYPAAAAAANALFSPSGTAWLLAMERLPNLALYGPNGFHPTPTGTFLAGLVLFETITGVDVQTLPRTATAAGRSISLDSATVRVLQSAAHDAVLGAHASR